MMGICQECKNVFICQKTEDKLAIKRCKAFISRLRKLEEIKNEIETLEALLIK